MPSIVGQEDEKISGIPKNLIHDRIIHLPPHKLVRSDYWFQGSAIQLQRSLL
jgi:hypothetical protein